MSNRRLLEYVIAFFVLAFVAAACGSDDTTDTADDATAAEDEMADMDEEEGHDEEGHDAEFAFGDPMAASDEARVIEISANDDFTFTPASISVTEGETVTFRVTNAGVIPHDFTLGDSATQDAHEAEMAEMADEGMEMHDEPNAFVLAAGETKETTWHLTQSGEIIFGCHQPGHYAAGMLGTITIES